MNSDFINGVLRSIAYYAIGFIVAWLTYLLFGWEYIHGPGLHHMIGILVLGGGAVLFIIRLVGLIRNPQNNIFKGSLLIHLLAIMGFVLFLMQLNIRGDETTIDAEAETLTIEKNTKTIIIKNGLEDTTFLQVADSVIIDKKGMKQ